MNADRTCFSCASRLNPTMSFPVAGVKNVTFCGDHYQIGSTYVCHPCAGQLSRVGVAQTPSQSE